MSRDEILADARRVVEWLDDNREIEVICDDRSVSLGRILRLFVADNAVCGDCNNKGFIASSQTGDGWTAAWSQPCTKCGRKGDITA